jgi:hypothetical protein
MFFLASTEIITPVNHVNYDQHHSLRGYVKSEEKLRMEEHFLRLP